MDDFDFGWFIGIFEGEGTIDTSGHGCSVRLRINSIDRDVLERVEVIVGGKLGPSYQQREKNKPLWSWSLMRKAEVEPLLERMIPYLCERRRQRAEFALNRIRTFKRKKRTSWPLTPIIHGTRSGYIKELKRGLPVCTLCRNASNEYLRKHRATKRELT